MTNPPPSENHVKAAGTNNIDENQAHNKTVTSKRKTSSFTKRLKKSVDKYGTILTAVAMLIAFYELYVVHQAANKIENLLRTADSQSSILTQQASALDQSAKQIDSLSRAAATRYINKFPENIKELTRMIATTESDLVIACDFAAYGNFSAPVEFRLYLEELKKLSENKKTVRVICYNDSIAANAREKQFGNDWIRIQNRPAFENFFSINPGISRPKSLKEFYDFLQTREAQLKRDMTDAGIHIEHVDSELPVFFWISDKYRAALSFYTYGDDPREMSFQTIDASLIGALLQVEKQIRTETFDTPK